VRAWYYSAVTADPTRPNTVYVMNLQVWRSIDGAAPSRWCGCRTATPTSCGSTPGLQAAHQRQRRGATVSFDAGATWSSIYNQPTAQFYHVTTDTQWPYRIYGAQQDNSTVSIASRSDDGVIASATGSRWPGARARRSRWIPGTPT
jgi:hypothetical protein